MYSLPLPPNPHAMAVLALAVFALFLFTRKNLPLETASFIILISLALGFELIPFQVNGETLHADIFFHGFGHEALVAVCALMIAGQGVVRTGALEPVGRGLASLWKISPAASLLLTLLVAAFISAFINNVPVVVLLLPILISVSIRTKIKSSTVLMPMGFATMLGGTCTTIGTSTNLLVVSVAADMGLNRMEMFDFLIPAAISGGIGILYLWLIVPRIMPERKLTLADASPRIFSAHLALRPESSIIGKTLAEAIKKAGGGMKVKGIRRRNDNLIMPSMAFTVVKYTFANRHSAYCQCVSEVKIALFSLGNLAMHGDCRAVMKTSMTTAELCQPLSQAQRSLGNRTHPHPTRPPRGGYA